MKKHAIGLSMTMALLAAMVPGIASAAQKSILMVVTSADQLAGGHKTGLWLEEYAVPYLLFTQAGFKVTVTSIQGGKPPVDPGSVKDGAQVFDWARAIVALEKTVAISKVDAKNFDAVFLPGGHGTMVDFPENAALKKLLNRFAAGDKVIASVCHGPSSFLGAKKADGTPLVAGKTITAFTNAEEIAAKLDTAVPFPLETKLREEGANFIAAADFTSHVQVDGKLVTGQNPTSSQAAAEAVIKLLKK